MPRTQLALENLTHYWPKELIGAKLGALLHPASILPDLSHSLDRLISHNGELFELKALFGPQHGIRGELQDNMIESAHELHPQLQIPIWSLYSETREPSAEMFQGLDALFIDLQDVGARYYTFVWTLYLCMKAAEPLGIHVVVHDRPNPIGNAVEGTNLELNRATFVGLHPIPARHGMTIGQLARKFQCECFPKINLTILPMAFYNPSHYYDETGLPWVLPSPNMPTIETAVVYPGQCLLEACNVSEGRGTTRPFEIFGAPWIDAPHLVAHLQSLDLAGIAWREHHFQPTFHKYASASVAGWNDEIFDQYRGQICHGAQMHITDRHTFKPLRTTVEILRYLIRQYPQFRWRPAHVGYEYEYGWMAIDSLLGNDWFRIQHIEGDEAWQD